MLFKNRKTAIFSEDRKYRYSLSRIWDPSKDIVCFIGLNPSTANEERNDNTITREINFAQSWGYGGLVKGNLFAYRTPFPEVLFKTVKNGIDPIGEDNEKYLISMSKDAKITVAVWGNHGGFLRRSTIVKPLLHNLHCLKLTRIGEPHHTLMLKKDLIPIKWETENVRPQGIYMK